MSIDQNILYVCMKFLKIIKCDIESNKKIILSTSVVTLECIRTSEIITSIEL